MKDTIAVAKYKVNSKEWHQRLKHMSEKRIKLLISKKQLSNLKDVDISLYEDCIYSKHKRVSFLKIERQLK